MAKRRVQAFTPPPAFGSYEVREPLGRGGMATVYRGEHTLLQRPVAIKFLHQNIAASPSARERFVREARLVAKLAHPNVVTVFDFGQLDDGTYYQTSELIAGDTLREFQARRGALPEAMALRFTRQLASGLRSAHDVGVIHRDLKPSNIMVVTDADDVDGFRLKVLDFGIAKSLESSIESNPDLTKAGVVIGTPGYMSPEQCLGDPKIGPPADIYSLGVVLFAMVVGHAPFTGENTEDLIDKHAHDHAPRPSESGAPASPAIDDLVARCLAKSPDQRPQTMRELIELIDGALASIGAGPAVRASGPVAAMPDLDRHTVRVDQPERAVRLAAASELTEAETVSFGEVVSPLPSPPVTRPNRRVLWIALAGAVAGTVVAIAIISAGADGSRAPGDPTPAAAPIATDTIDAGIAPAVRDPVVEAPAASADAAVSVEAMSPVVTPVVPAAKVTPGTPGTPGTPRKITPKTGASGKTGKPDDGFRY